MRAKEDTGMHSERPSCALEPFDAEKFFAARVGNPQKAFDDFFIPHRNVVFKICLMTLRNSADAEDACAETFVKAWRNIHGFRGDCLPRSWLCQIAINKCLDMAKTKRSHSSIDDFQGTVDEEGYSQIERSETIAIVQQEIAMLPKHLRSFIQLHLIEELQQSEIADILQCPFGTVKSRLSRGSQMLRDAIEQHHSELVPMGF